MNVARRHHFVPDFYLQGFTHPIKKNLTVLDRIRGKTFEQASKNVAYEIDFNTVDIPDQSPDALEKAYARFEGQAARSLRRIGEAGYFCDADDLITLQNVIALLAVRHPRMRDKMSAAIIQSTRIITDILLSSKERYESQMRRAIKDGVLDKSLSYEEMKDFHDRGEYEIQVNREGHIQREIKLFQTVLECLVPRKWSIVRAPEGYPFITTDDPVSLCFNDGTQGYVGYGLRNTDVIFPISQRLLAIGRFEGMAQVIDADVKHVAALNSITAAHARTQVYAPSLDFYYCPEDGSLAQGAALLKEPFFQNEKDQLDEKTG